MNSREYAKQLVGDLKREHFDEQRGILDKNYQTNWENLQNQFKNLTEDLKKRQELANRSFNNGLVDVADRSYDRMNNGMTNMANKGLTVSGLNNLVEQADTERKGKEVLGLLDSLGDVNVNVSKGLANATSKATRDMAEMNKDMGDALGDVGAADIAVQMAYNSGLAGIAGSKDARDAQKQLEAMRDAARARASAGGGRDEIDKKVEEAYRRQAITNLLRNVDDEGNDLGMDEQQRANALRILLDVNNSEDVVKMFDENANYTENQKAMKKELDKLTKNNSIYDTDYANTPTSNYFNSLGKPNFEKNYGINKGDVNDINRIYGNSTPNGLNNLIKESAKNKEIKQRIDELNNNLDIRKLSYQELADLLYGNR